MKLLRFIALVSLLVITSLSAHDGLENETEVRVHKDRIEVTVRSSLLFAWKLLGKDAPADTSAASLEKARPKLVKIAPDLVALASHDQPLKLRSAECVFELEEHAAFVLVYEIPSGSPTIGFKASFFKTLGGLEEGTFRLVDLTRDPLSRDVEPLARKRLHRADDSFNFTCGPGGVSIPAAKPTPSAQDRR